MHKPGNHKIQNFMGYWRSKIIFETFYHNFLENHPVLSMAQKVIKKLQLSESMHMNMLVVKIKSIMQIKAKKLLFQALLKLFEALLSPLKLCAIHKTISIFSFSQM